MENTDWSIGDVFIVDESCVAFRVERDRRGEYETARAMHFLKTFHHCVKRSLTTARKSHCRNSTGIDARMLCKEFQGAIAIQHLCQPSKLSLIVAHVRQTSSRKAVYKECRHAKRVQHRNPIVHISYNPA